MESLSSGKFDENWTLHDTNDEHASHSATPRHSTRAPLIVSDPRMQAAGRQTNALVEFVDIYPTLCELAKLPLPDHLEGTSFAPLLDESDPQENVNVANRPENAELVKQLTAQLAAGWRAALPASQER